MLCEWRIGTVRNTISHGFFMPVKTSSAHLSQMALCDNLPIYECMNDRCNRRPERWNGWGWIKGEAVWLV